MAVVQKWTSAEAREAAASIVRALGRAGHTAYFAGGCVRDELLGRAPVDYDVATDARPERICELFRSTTAVGASFGVVLVRERGATVEVATFRADGPYSDRRRPDSVTFSDPEHDARRRDFTVNALFLDPLASADAPSIRGHVIDLVGGLADLDARLIRAVGDPERRLAEDHLRALRAVRFSARYGFEIEPSTESAIRDHAADLAGVSRERIGDELRRMMADPSRHDAVARLHGLGLDGVVLGGDARPLEGGSLSRLGGDDPGFAACLACWAFDRGDVGSEAHLPRLVSGWRRALCLSNEERSRLREILAGVLEMERGWGGLPVAARKRRAASPWFAEALAVATARDAPLGEAVRANVEALAADGVGLAPEPFLNGNDLMRLGIEAGPVYARVLAAIYDAQIEGRIAGKAEAEALAAELSRER